MKLLKLIRALVALVLVLAACAVPCWLFYQKTPVLVVTDASFAVLYGESRLKRQQVITSLTLFRLVKPVIIADGAGADIVVSSITEASEEPWCVLFPRSQSSAALRFHEQFPETPAVLMRGHSLASSVPAPDGILCVYGTDFEADLYRAGLFAGIIGGAARREAESREESADGAAIPKKVVLWQDRFVQAAGRRLFTSGVTEEDPELTVVFANLHSDMPNEREIACAVITGAGADYLEKNPKIPLILFTWLDPALTSQEVALVFDDSLWTLAVPAVRLAEQKNPDAKIPSKPLIFSGKTVKKDIVNLLKNSAEKLPQED